MMLQVAVEEFLLDKTAYCAPRTVRNYSEHLARFLKYAPEDVEQLAPDVIRGYIIHLKGRKTRNVTINCYVRSVKVFCKWLLEYEYTDIDLFRRVKMPRPDPKLKVPLSMAEVRRIDEQLLKLRDKVIFHLMLDAGLRVSEVCKLKKKDIDLENRLIYVDNSKYNKSRIVPMASNLAYLLEKYHQEKNEVFLLCSKTGSQMTDNLVKQLFQDLKVSSGVDRLHAHLLRHTFATSYIVGGGNLEKLRIMLGHSDYSVTQNYLHLAAQFEVVRYPIYQLDPVFFQRGY